MNMLLNKPEIFASLTICLSVAVSACANNDASKELEKIFAADPQLKNNPPFNQSTQTSTQNKQQPEETLKLPSDVPLEISPTPNSELLDQSEPAEISTLPPTPEGEIQPLPEVLPTPLPTPTAAALSTPTPSPPNIIPRALTPIPSESPVLKKALRDVPMRLRPYIIDLSKLGLFPQQELKSQYSPDGTTILVKPQNLVSRRVYARWLVSANNKMFANNPAKNIRLARANEKQVFQDVPETDPDFAAIQGLAEAGLIPSPLSGDINVVKFRPDNFLTREDLILWKVPLDFRKPLPEATIEKVKTVWDFQDASRIDPSALRAVLADGKNDFSNIRRVFGYTRLFRPDKTVSRAEAAAILWYFGDQKDGISAQMVLESKRQS